MTASGASVGIEVETLRSPNCRRSAHSCHVGSELRRTFEDARDVLGVVRAADVRARVTETLEYGNTFRRALEPRAQPAIRCFGFLLDLRDELG
jgi:hypothetical protein